MAEIGDVNPLTPPWPTRPAGDQKQPPPRQQNKKKKPKQSPNRDDDGKPHVDEYA